MGETKGMTYLKAKFLSICGPVYDETVICFQIIIEGQTWNTYHIPKWTVGNKKGIMGSKEVQNTPEEIY